jgi:two-component system nitrate/nitrite response regulator NarL
MKLLLADDHALFRDALVQYIERLEPEAEVLLAKDFYEAMKMMEENEAPDLVLLDINMPGMDGLDGLKNFRQTYPDVSVSIMSGVAEKAHIDKAMEMGAMGYFPKTMSGKALIQGMKQVIDGTPYVAMDSNGGEYMPSFYSSEGYGADGNKLPEHKMLLEGREIHLTPREKDVLAYLVYGASNKEIANELGLQEVTVKLHVRGICRKLEAKNRTQAALKAKELGLAAGEN